MNQLPEFLTGSISSEYGALSAKGGGVKKKKSSTGTCGSDCSDPGIDPCQENETCGDTKPKPKPTKPPYKKKAFFPVVEGWNEPPAAHL